MTGIITPIALYENACEFDRNEMLQFTIRKGSPCNPRTLRLNLEIGTGRHAKARINGNLALE